MPVYNLKINGTSYNIKAEQDTPLLWVLRDYLDMVGTKYGCGIGQCGACTVHVDGSATRSCLLQVSMVEDMEITTIEGLSKNTLHPVQEAWKEIDVPQCGYCQTGQIMSATAFLSQNKNPNKTEIRDAMSGNICRCASYNRIEKAVELAASKLS
ncbi:(2Fe-2S)-binding protein [Aquimarina muelleri]|uniref:(2Fe-2S)-binding protein n=1 Tax=Aquimarina muelleri TaxID=279356 RepID=A0A918N2Z1_9FLAO|nr:(2Fe-2S)-binding protein [Aquimarina muelleri]MCX2761735.1 (2Fe-2S)-binding protein [Aquimarina muelleri]GGX15783.1 (2Fe-2S)-binding protein [Aquimarina muelleri]